MSDPQAIIRLQFLEEAEEYLGTIEKELVDLSQASDRRSQVDLILRAAHSIKGGAAMMGFNTLSELAHQLEDFFKVMRSGKNFDQSLERQLLQGVDRLHQVLQVNRQGTDPSPQWLESQVQPLFAVLREQFGDPQPDADLAMLSEEAGDDMRSLLFESEVEGCLQRLESVLQTPEHPCLLEEFAIVAQELAGLGQMLELSQFSQFCTSIAELLEQQPTDLRATATKILKDLRHCQALVLTQQINALPSQFVAQDQPPEGITLEANSGLAATFPQTKEVIHQNQITATRNSENIQSSLTVAEARQLDFTPETITTQTLHPPINATDLTSEINQARTVRVGIQQLEDLSELFGELNIERNGLSLQLKRMRQLLQTLKTKVRRLEQSSFELRSTTDRAATATTAVSLAGSGGSSWHQNFDILEFDRYSPLHLVSQDVMETIVQIQEITSDIETNLEETEQTEQSLRRTAKQMQGRLTQVRMRPFADLVNRYPRMIRQLGQEYGKDVQLIINGENTLVDRAILELLADPLLHLVRNAFDHGVESPQLRQSRDKSPTATIEVSAAYRGNQTVITIRDDGCGVDLQKIRQRAQRMGLDQSSLEAASDRELLDLIFEPGFTTAEQVTELSGRGVGMDVVRTNLQQIRGDIQIETKPNQGTTFTITVPFSLSVARVLLIEVSNILVAIPTDVIEEIIELNPSWILNSAGQTVLNLDETLVPLLQLDQWFQFSRPCPPISLDGVPTINQPTVLLVNQGNSFVGIQVDRYWGEQEVTIRQVNSTIPLPPGFSSCTILGDGRIVPLVDTFSLLQWIQNSNVPSRLSLKAIQPATYQLPSQKSILIIDDSINVRRFLANILEKAGYRVEQAKDGQEAIDKLKDGLKVEAAICDVEMPRLDGYGFLTQVKNIVAGANLPIAMLTSRSGDKHRRLALNLGAAAYFTKPFREPELLQTLQELIQVKQS
ncbi:hybrid sensor histidine kinase/response regulator [Synechococcus elongatus]|uniref:hybrid sensor histidine kinase/response regulator n=1 Tax=Synechococcus elongatus TaxID=32046 RepID=UPI000F7F6C1E|nr:response regulator [Synechococcus elongatus]